MILRTLAVTLVVALAIIAGSAGYGFASNNAQMPGAGGDGSGDVSGFIASGISYSLNTVQPHLLDAVSFDLADVTGPVKVKVQLAGGGAWYNCAASPTDAGHITCTTTTPQPSIASISTLRVVAAE